jgi:hypothetical protein
MADKFLLSGSWTTAPMSGSASLDPSFAAAIDESYVLDGKDGGFPVTLTTDAEFVVSFGSLVNANIVILKSDGKCKARLTSTDGATQSIPVDTVFISISQSVPFTALGLTRLPGAETTVRVFLAKIA